jgi:hypothetical protein
LSVTLNALPAAGRPVPPSASTTALIDTGSEITGVAPLIPQQPAVPVQYHTTTQRIGGSVPVRLFLVTLFILDSSSPHLPWMVRPDMLVMELPSGFPVEVLIDMDVLRTCKLLVEGPAGRFDLEF